MKKNILIFMMFFIITQVVNAKEIQSNPIENAKEIQLDWIEDEDVFEDHIVYWGTELNNYTNSSEVKSPTTTYIIKGLSNDDEIIYYISVKALDKDGNYREIIFEYFSYLRVKILKINDSCN